jgi:hypothetical protein
VYSVGTLVIDPAPVEQPGQGEEADDERNGEQHLRITDHGEARVPDAGGERRVAGDVHLVHHHVRAKIEQQSVAAHGHEALRHAVAPASSPRRGPPDHGPVLPSGRDVGQR